MKSTLLLNGILNTDSYKPSHWLQYPPGTTIVQSYIESRGGEWDFTQWFGLQIWLKEYLSKPITQEMIEQAEIILKAHGEPFNREGWEYIVNEHRGYLPIRIRAVPEGTNLPTKNVLAIIENTDPKCFWLPSYVETAALRAAWYGTTVSTLSKSIKKMILRYLEETGDPSLINFKLHDFGARGVSSKESAGIGGAAHLVNFMGTDTIEGMLYSMVYYNTSEVTGFSIPAAEHSTITAYGREGEVEAFRNMLHQFAKPGALVAVVSDSYDIYNACENLWGGVLKQEVIDSGAVVVVRPDSGHPATVVVNCARILASKFGYTTNDKGYMVLNNVRIIQGDGINETSIREILFSLKMARFSADNIAFGMGGALLQGINRDSLKFAQKACAMLINDTWVDIFKEPITDPGKNSKRGRLDLYKDEQGQYDTLREDPTKESQLVTVFENGKLTKEWTFAEVRAVSNS